MTGVVLVRVQQVVDGGVVQILHRRVVADLVHVRHVGPVHARQIPVPTGEHVRGGVARYLGSACTLLFRLNNIIYY